MLTHRLGRVLIAGVALASLTASLATTPAFARIKAPGLDSLSQECFRVQSESDKLIAEYKNASNDRREQILTDLRRLGSYWIAAGCKKLYGDISALQRVPRDDYQAPTSLSGAGDAPPVSDGGVTPVDPGPILY